MYASELLVALMGHDSLVFKLTVVLQILKIDVRLISFLGKCKQTHTCTEAQMSQAVTANNATYKLSRCPNYLNAKRILTRFISVN